MEFEGWLQIGLLLLLIIGGYVLIRRPRQRKRMFDLATGRLKRRRQANFSHKPLQHCRR